MVERFLDLYDANPLEHGGEKDDALGDAGVGYVLLIFIEEASTKIVLLGGELGENVLTDIYYFVAHKYKLVLDTRSLDGLDQEVQDLLHHLARVDVQKHHTTRKHTHSHSDQVHVVTQPIPSSISLTVQIVLKHQVVSLLK